MRRLLLLPLLCLALPAQAAPVHTGRLADVRFVLDQGEGASLRVGVSALSTSGGDRLEVSVVECALEVCEQPRYYAGPLQGTLAIDPQTTDADVSTVVGRHPLSVRWSPAPTSGVVVGSTHAGGTGADGSLTTWTGTPASVVLRLGDATCRGRGGVGDALHVEAPDGAAGDSRPLAQLRLPAGPVVCTE